MFTLKSSHGKNHHIYSYDENKYNFKNYLQKILNINSLDNVNEICDEYLDNKEKIITNDFNFNDLETSLHKKFYDEIKKNNIFKEMYCNLIKDIYDFFFFIMKKYLFINLILV